MIGGMLVIGIIIIGFCIILGVGKTADYFKFLAWMIMASIFLAVFCNNVFEVLSRTGNYQLSAIWRSMPLWAQVTAVVLALFIFAALIRHLFPKSQFISFVFDVLMGALVSIFLFPFRFVWRAGRLLNERERIAARLNPTRPVVGARPPFIDPR